MEGSYNIMIIIAFTEAPYHHSIIHIRLICVVIIILLAMVIYAVCG
jgi:hypothetical protein